MKKIILKDKKIPKLKNRINSRVVLVNIIYNKYVVLGGKNLYLKELLNLIIHGVDNETLLKTLKKLSERPKELYEYLLQNFIIE